MSLKRITDGVSYASPGAFRHRVTITKPGTDTYGNKTAGTAVASSIAAAVFDLKETSTRDKALTEIVIRDRSAMIAVRVGMQVSVASANFRTRTFQILSIADPDSNWKEKHLMCEEFIPTQCT